MSTLGPLQKSINLGRYCGPDLVFAGIDGLDPVIMLPPGDNARYLRLGLSSAFPTINGVLFGLFGPSIRLELFGPPVLPPFTPGNTVPAPELDFSVLAKPDFEAKTAGAISFTLSATVFPVPPQDDPQGFGLVALQGSCSQIMGVVDVGELLPAGCPVIESVTPAAGVVGMSVAVTIVGQNITEPFTLTGLAFGDVPFPVSPAGPPSPTSQSFTLDLTGPVPTGGGRLVLTPADPLCPATEVPFLISPA